MRAWKLFRLAQCTTLKFFQLLLILLWVGYWVHTISSNVDEVLKIKSVAYCVKILDLKNIDYLFIFIDWYIGYQPPNLKSFRLLISDKKNPYWIPEYMHSHYSFIEITYAGNHLINVVSSKWIIPYKGTAQGKFFWVIALLFEVQKEHFGESAWSGLLVMKRKLIWPTPINLPAKWNIPRVIGFLERDHLSVNTHRHASVGQLWAFLALLCIYNTNQQKSNVLRKRYKTQWVSWKKKKQMGTL